LAKLIKTVSIVVPVYNEELVIHEFLTSLEKFIVKNKKYRFTLIVVNDGSIDDTIRIVKQFKSKVFKIALIDLPINIGHQKAICAGILKSNSDCTITMDSDLQHPFELITQMLLHWEEGFEIVQGVRTSTIDNTFTKKIFSIAFYKVFSFVSSYSITPGSSDFRLIGSKSRTELKNHLNRFPNHDVILRVLFPMFAFKTKEIEFQAAPRPDGQSKFSARKMLKLAFAGLVSYSRLPIILSILFLVFSCLLLFSLLFLKLQSTVNVNTLNFVSFLFVILMLLFQLTVGAISLLLIYKVHKEIVYPQKFRI
jgi:glycosyltransferase involved in cell wall biosynthesis